MYLMSLGVYLMALSLTYLRSVRLHLTLCSFFILSNDQQSSCWFLSEDVEQLMSLVLFGLDLEGLMINIGTGWIGLGGLRKTTATVLMNGPAS